MNGWKSVPVSAATMVAAGLVLGLTLSGSGHAQGGGQGNGQANGQAPADVRVVNTTAAPVPVALQGTPVAVSLEGTPVPVAIQGTPIPVTETVRPWGSPFSAKMTLTFAEGHLGALATPTVQVPVGKRLVLETVSYYGQLLHAPDTDQQITQVNVRLDFDKPGLYLDIPPSHVIQAFVSYSHAQSVRAYADSSVAVSAVRDTGAGDGSFEVTVFGFLVDK
jgi:hypothetical protein